jgi:translation initiation factor eIF-2B subunit delta
MSGAIATTTHSSMSDHAGSKSSREVVKADREAIKEAKRAAKAAAQAKKAGGSGAVPTGGAAAGSSQQGAKKQPQQAGGSGPPKKQQSNEKGAVSTPSTSAEAIESGDRSSSSKGRTTNNDGIQPSINASTPSVLGGVSLFGNVSTSTHTTEISQHVVSALYRSQIHPSVLKLAQHLSSFTIVGADARAIAVLKALRDFVVDYRTPSGAAISRDLVTKLGPQIGFLVLSRPLGASVGHAIRYLKYEISVTPVELNEEEVSLE